MFSIFALNRKGLLQPGNRCSGIWSWRHPATAEVLASASYAVSMVTRPYSLRLQYRVSSPTGEVLDVDLTCLLQSTPCHFGGLRWWLTCPLAKDGAVCGRRVAKLYLPPYGAYFGCRACHDLTYRSSQESDRRIQALKKLGALAVLQGMKTGEVDLFDGLKALSEDAWW